jgi:hypothetical protein
MSLVLACAGCGRAHVEPAEPPEFAPGAAAAPASTQSASELDALEQALAENEQRLSAYLADSHGYAFAEGESEDKGAAPAPQADAPATEFSRPPPSAAKPKKREAAGNERASSAGAPAPARAPAAPASPPAPAEEGAVQPDAGSSCELACRALSSMRRAADRICSIAGESAPRCSRARVRVETASGRVNGASCVCRDAE